MNLPREFIADITSPERRQLTLFHSGIEASSHGALAWLGWELIIDRVSEAGECLREWDTWERTFLEILRAATRYADEPIVWRLPESNGEVDLNSLQPKFDESMRLATSLKTVVSPEENERVCLNIYDDGHYRFTVEERLRYAGLEAWEPKDWSGEYPSLEAAVSAARRKFGWMA